MNDAPRLAALLLAAAALCAAPAARAVDPLSTFDSAPGRKKAPRSPAREADADPGEGRAGPARAPLLVVVQSAFDLGLTEFGTVTMTDGTTQTLTVNGGFSLGLGASFLHLADGLLSTQAVIGFEWWSIGASGDTVRWLAFPLEVIEFVNVGPLRFGAGASLLVSPSFQGEGMLSPWTVEAENSLGLLLQADWVIPLAGSARGSTATLGVRYEQQRLTAKVGGGTADASAIGIVGAYSL